MGTLKEFPTVLSGFLTPVIAILTLIIAYSQYRIQEYKVRFDLYGPRMKIYESIMDFLKRLDRKVMLQMRNLFFFFKRQHIRNSCSKGKLQNTSMQSRSELRNCSMFRLN